MERVLHLTEEQQKIVNLARQGHNICIFGRAGVGKSTTVIAIKEALAAKGENVQIICSTGIACESYGGIAKTVHSQYGLRVAELPSELLIERSLSQNVTVKQVADTTVLIWDEVSMSSTRILELVNKIHHMVTQNSFAFGGIQVILVGDFWQLKPIPSPFDEGKSIYLSELFDKVFQHRIELTKILRQGESESRLKNLLDELRNGDCSEEAEEYVHSLERECTQEEAGTDPIHIYFKKLHVEVHNGNVLATLPGRLDTVESIDQGNTKCLEKMVPRSVSLKSGCNIMLKYNINDQLKNGYQGRYIGKDPNNDNALLVHFAKVGTISITRRTWYNYDVDGTVQGSRTQFPITLCYAITVHKSQSLTLDSIVVHCAQEFVPGQTYVAISRVRSEDYLQVIGFQRKFLLPPPVELSTMATFCVDPDETLSCCRNQPLDDSFFEDNTYTSAVQPVAEIDEVLNDDENLDLDAALQSESYCQLDEAVTAKLEDTLLCLLPPSHIAAPPSTFSIESFLTSNTTDLDDPFSESINSATRYAIDHLQAFQLLANIIWVRIAILFQKHTSITNKEFTFATTQVHKMLSSDEYRNDLLTAFQLRKWTDIDDGKRTLGVQLTFHLYQLFVTEVERALQHESVQPMEFNVREMGVNGLGKLRYVGGWAIHKSLASSRRYLIANKKSQVSNVREKLNNELRKIDLLDNNIITPYAVLEKITSDVNTLNVTEFRQYRERGLLHITDEAFQFFLSLEQERVNLISLERLSLWKDQVVDRSIESVLENRSIRNEFVALFDLKLDGDKVN
jgi:hypothetical protein